MPHATPPNTTVAASMSARDAFAVFHDDVSVHGASVTVSLVSSPKALFTLSASDVIPPELSVLGSDERLALHDKTVVAYLALRTDRSVARAGPIVFTVRFDARPLVSDEFFVAYRGADDAAWNLSFAGPGKALSDDGREIVIRAEHWHGDLKAHAVYSFVIYHKTNGIG